MAENINKQLFIYTRCCQGTPMHVTGYTWYHSLSFVKIDRFNCATNKYFFETHCMTQVIFFSNTTNTHEKISPF